MVTRLLGGTYRLDPCPGQTQANPKRTNRAALGGWSYDYRDYLLPRATYQLIGLCGWSYDYWWYLLPRALFSSLIFTGDYTIIGDTYCQEPLISSLVFTGDYTILRSTYCQEPCQSIALYGWLYDFKESLLPRALSIHWSLRVTIRLLVVATAMTLVSSLVFAGDHTLLRSIYCQEPCQSITLYGWTYDCKEHLLPRALSVHCSWRDDHTIVRNLYCQEPCQSIALYGWLYDCKEFLLPRTAYHSCLLTYITH